MSKEATPARSAFKRKVLLVDDHPILGEGFAQLIDHEPDLQVCGQADSACEAMKYLEAQKPALAYEGCLCGHTTLFTTAIDIVNTLGAAQAVNRLKSELKKYLTPAILLVDELGYLPIDKNGADLLFQVFSERYETGSTIVTTNQAYKNWAKIFNNDATLTSAVLDRLLHHAETITLEGKSYRMKDQIEEP
jgi:DNA replication protein DnaC